MQAAPPNGNWLPVLTAAIAALAALGGGMLTQWHSRRIEAEKQRAETAERRRAERLAAYQEFVIALEALRNAEMEAAFEGGSVSDQADRAIRASQLLRIIAPKEVWQAAHRLNLGATSRSAEGWPAGGAPDLRERYEAFYAAARADLDIPGP